MKRIILSTILLAMLTGCGVGEKICPRGAIPMGCNALVGEEKANLDDFLEVQAQQEEMLLELDELSFSVTSLYNISNALFNNFNAEIAALRAEVRKGDKKLLKKIRRLRRAIIELNDGIADIIDPCGEETSHDEVLVRLSDNVIIAYFQGRGGKRLTVLEEGADYRTTDGTNCRFKIEDGEVVGL